MRDLTDLGGKCEDFLGEDIEALRSHGSPTRVGRTQPVSSLPPGPCLSLSPGVNWPMFKAGEVPSPFSFLLSGSGGASWPQRAHLF